MVINMKLSKFFQNKTVVLTGASSGIGKGLCLLLIKKGGARVIGIGRSQEKMLSLQKELGEDADKFSFSLFDVSVRQNWLNFAANLAQNGVCVDILINNAGAFASFLKAANTSAETYRAIAETNYLSAVYATSATLPLIPKQKECGIVNVCSSAALCSVVGTAAYSASKTALKAYTECLMMEEKDRFIAVYFPGTTKTELFRNDENTKNSALDLVATSADKMAKKIAKCIAKKKKRAVLGIDAKLMNFTAKVAPVWGLKMIAWVMKKSKSKVFKNVFLEE